MGTRANIAIKNEDGSFTSVYLHWDGYPSHTLPILEKYYNTEEKVRELLSFGNMSMLASKISPEEDQQHSFSSPAKDVCVFYGRDRNEKNQEQQVSNLLPLGVGYDYIFMNGHWSWARKS